MDINEFQDKINKCKDCLNDEYLKKFIIDKKPKSFFLESKINTIILGHSPRVRTQEEAEYVLKMNEPNRPLYKYIHKELLAPLNINVNNIYCTNLIKCHTNIMPEDIKDNKKFLLSSSKNCKKLFEEEVSLINPKLIISLSEFVLTFISKEYHSESLSMKESFGELFDITIGGKSYKYIPVVHIPKGKVRTYYFKKQTLKLKRYQNIIYE